MNAPSQYFEQTHHEPRERNDGYQLRMYAVFVGLSLAAGRGLVDTGAQEGTLGLQAWKKWMPELTKRGLRPYEMPIPAGREACEGVGGASRIVTVADVPVGIAGVNGLLRVTVIEDTVEQEVPTLIPINLMAALAGVVDTREETVNFKVLGVTAQCQRESTGHLTMSLLEFAEGGWTLPEYIREQYQHGSNPFVAMSEGARVAASEDVRLSAKSSRAQRVREEATSLIANGPTHIRDYWIETGNGWARVHVRPRRCSFNPAGCQKGPLPELLTCDRFA